MSQNIKLLSCGFIALIGVSFFYWLGQGARVDLTENSIYTLSEGTENLIADLENPVTIKLYFSQQGTQEIVQLRNYARRVKELLHEMASVNPAKITVEVIDPEPFSEAEDQAAAYGLTSAPVALGNEVYFGLVVEAHIDPAKANNPPTPEVVEFIQLDREEFLEYDVAKRIYTAANPKKPTIGMISGLEVNGGMDVMSRQPKQPWMSFKQLQSLYDVEEIAADAESIDTTIEVLLLVQPKALSEQLLYAIDQFALRGGKVLAFLDPLANSDPGMPNQPDSQGEDGGQLNSILHGWGVEVVPGQVVGDAELAMMVNQGQGQQPTRHIAVQSYTPEQMGTMTFVQQLSQINLATPGAIQTWEPLPADTTEPIATQVEPILQTSKASGLIPRGDINPAVSIAQLAQEFQPDGQQRIIAASVIGQAISSFSAPPTDDKPANEDSKEAPKKVKNTAEHVSEGEINAIIVADTDILTDYLWVQVLGQFQGQAVAQPFADNGNFFINTIDFLSGSSDLMNIRSRGTYSRPFTRVDTLRKAAEERFRNQEIALNEQLQATEQKLAELQQGDDQQLELNAEQQQAIVDFQQERLNIRKSLREVNLKLNQEIRDLGLKVKAINIFLVPMLLFIFAIIFFSIKHKRMGAKRHA